VTSGHADNVQPEAEFDWMKNLLKFVAASSEPQTTIHSPTASSFTASTPMEPDVDSETAVESATLASSVDSEYPNSQASEIDGLDDEDLTTSSTRATQHKKDSLSPSCRRQHNRRIYSILRTPLILYQGF
jgi:hypothetical protein